MTDKLIEALERVAHESILATRSGAQSVGAISPISIPDKLYAKARAEGYEAGMRDAARLACRCGKLEFQELLLDVKFRTKLLKDMGVK